MGITGPIVFLVIGILLLILASLLFQNDWYLKDPTKRKYAAILMLYGSGFTALIIGFGWGLLLLFVLT